ncbi:hypothetical protein cyc_09195 [Cyclospora cayetanensis]|uniref:Uncharacterized protein n=1 Tax=Cyclospora cayetanensis TaxID=88456 RepID=A0A1D3DAG6_9EIME|nr:hypothetical protein cyc_09195 [Cyclospora cayetanensis]
MPIMVPLPLRLMWHSVEADDLSLCEGLLATWRLPLERLKPLLLIDRLAPEEEPWISGTTMLAVIGLPVDICCSHAGALLAAAWLRAVGASPDTALDEDLRRGIQVFREGGLLAGSSPPLLHDGAKDFQFPQHHAGSAATLWPPVSPSDELSGAVELFDHYGPSNSVPRIKKVSLLLGADASALNALPVSSLRQGVATAGTAAAASPPTGLCSNSLPAMALLHAENEAAAKKLWLVFSSGECMVRRLILVLAPSTTG